MKKTVIILLIGLLLLTGCGSSTDKKKNTDPKTSLNQIVTAPQKEAVNTAGILDKAAAGEMEPMQAKLGEDLNVVYDKSKQAGYKVVMENFDSDNPYALFNEGRYYVEISKGENGSSNRKITKMTCEYNPYGLSTGAVNIEDFVASMGTPVSRDEIPAAQLYFSMDKSNDALKLTYDAGDNQLEFYFVNNQLSAAVLSVK